MALIDLDDFKAVLGVGDLYPDATLEAVMTTAEEIILPYLKLNRASIRAGKIVDNVATFTTVSETHFSPGMSVIITKAKSTFNGTYTVTKVGVDYFQVAKTHADYDEHQIYPWGQAIEADNVGIYDSVEPVRQAALMIAVDIWSSRQSAAGQAQGVDFTPGPYRMGRSILSRVMGLIANYREPGSMVG